MCHGELGLDLPTQGMYRGRKLCHGSPAHSQLPLKWENEELRDTGPLAKLFWLRLMKVQLTGFSQLSSEITGCGPLIPNCMFWERLSIAVVREMILLLLSFLCSEYF